MLKTLRPSRIFGLKYRLRLVSKVRRIPMPLLSILIGLFCGILVWLALDQVQSRALRDIFSEELNTRLDQQARETLIRFESYVAAHTSTTRLLANHRNLANYLEPIYWYDADGGVPVIHYENPPWLPSAALWQTLVRPSQVLLMDRSGQTREIYNVGDDSFPGDLLQVDELFLSGPRVQAFMTTLQGKLYLLVSETAEDATGTNMGYLMLVVPIDDRFLDASQQGVSTGGVVVALMDAEQQFLASSDPSRVPDGSRLEQISERFEVTAQSFFEYEGSNLNTLFATLVPRSSVEATLSRVEAVDRRQRLVAAVAFVTVFTLVFYLLSARLNRILRRISHFSRRALGVEQPVIEKGNQIFVLEDWIRQFIGQVRRARDQMRMEHETEMQESEALQQALMEGALDSIITIDREDRIIEFNPTAERIFGHQRSGAIGESISSLVIQSESRQSFKRMLQRFTLSQGAEIQETRSEMEAVRSDGVAFPVELAIKPIRLQQREVFTVYIHDITNRKRAEQEISSLAKFPSESPSPVLRVNRLGAIIFANPASALLLEYWGCEKGQTLPLYWRKRVSNVFESGRDWEVELTIGKHHYSLLMTPIVELDYVNIYGRDITAVRKAESRAREHQQELVHVCRLSTMGGMATGLAHELNQPLAAIANYANGCTRRLQSDGRDEHDLIYALGQINSQADRAGEIIKRLRRLVGKQLPVRVVADINELVREVCTFVEFEARKTGVVIEQELSLDGLPVRADVVQIEQVLLNLIRNALDALLDVDVEHRNLVLRTGREGKRIQVNVIDTGPGIDPETASHLFEPFFTTKESGMGMGLVISQTIVEDHNGRIEARPVAGGGSCFRLILPAYQADEETDIV